MAVFSVLGPDAVLRLQLATCFVLFAAIFAFCLSPGGLAWALSKACPSNSGGARRSYDFDWGAFIWGDHFPLLRSLDLQGVRRRCRQLCEKVNAFVGAIVEHPRLAPFGAGRSYDFDWGDHFPLLRSLDLQVVRRRCRQLCEKVNAFVGAIVEHPRLAPFGAGRSYDFNWGDHFPLLRSLGLQGMRRRCRRLCERLPMEMRQSLVCRAIHRRVQV